MGKYHFINVRLHMKTSRSIFKRLLSLCKILCHLPSDNFPNNNKKEVTRHTLYHQMLLNAYIQGPTIP